MLRRGWAGLGVSVSSSRSGRERATVIDVIEVYETFRTVFASECALRLDARPIETVTCVLD